MPPRDVESAAGHRARLRERFLAAPDALPDYEIIELLLMTAIPRRDVKPLAKALIDRFGDLAGVIHADVAQLRQVEGLGEAGIAALKLIHEGASRLLRAPVAKRPVLANWTALVDYLRAAMAHSPREEFRVLFLNRKNHLIADDTLGEGTVDHTPVYPREVVKRALDIGASAIILVHNHPSGDPKPSKGDIAMTRALVDACKRLDIDIHDHVIVAKGGYESFKRLGLL